MKNNSQEGKNITINKELAKLYIEQLKELAQEEKILNNIEVGYCKITRYFNSKKWWRRRENTKWTYRSCSRCYKQNYWNEKYRGK